MEGKDPKGKWWEIVKVLPNYASLIISIGGIIFSLGVMYNSLNTMKARMDSMDNTNLMVLRLDGRLQVLNNQIVNNGRIINSTSGSVQDLSDAINDMGVSISVLQDRLSVLPPPRKTRRK